MAKNVSDVLIDTMMEWGVDTVFGLPGDGIDPIMEALRVRKDKVRFIHVRHEEGAAFAACAYAKYTGKLGCCLATSGPGGIHLMNGLADAMMDQAPVLAITGQTYSDLQQSHFQQDVMLTRMMEPLTVYNVELINPAAARRIANEACRHALNRRGVAHVMIPVDYQDASLDTDTSPHDVAGHTNNTWMPSPVIPSEGRLRDAARILNDARKPVMLIGQGAKGARDEVIKVADTLGAPIVKALLGKEVVPDTHPLCIGGIGLLGTEPSQTAMEECDALLIVGSSFPYMDYLPDHKKARGVLIDDKGDRIGLRYPVEVGLVGDARATLDALLPHLEKKRKHPLLDDSQKRMKDWWKLMEERAMRDDEPIKPQRVAWELSQLADDDCIVSGDSGTNTTWIARYFQIRGEQKFSCSGNLATMAPGLPYAIAAKAAFPKRQSIAFVGDGGFTMLMQEFATACQHDLPILVVIIKNNILGQIKWEQIVFLGNPQYGVQLSPINFAKFAEACGGVGFSVDKPEDIRPALKQAMASGKPAIVEVLVDPNEPPMPPKVSLKQAEHFAEALVRGEPHGGKIAQTLFRDKISELV